MRSSDCVTLLLSLLAAAACRSDVSRPGEASSPAPGSVSTERRALRPHLPLVRIAELDLPGRPARFDYQAIDASSGQLVIAHMNDSAVLFVRLSDGSVLKRLTGIPAPRGVAIAGDVGRVFVTSSPHSLVLIDGKALVELGRVQTGNGPDGVAWDAQHQIVGVSDQRDGALSLISGAGLGARRAIPLGKETGNVVFDAVRGWFWVTVLMGSTPDRLLALSPLDGEPRANIPLPGCDGAHGLRLHPQGDRAFVACESNDMLLEVELGAGRVAATLPTGSGPDVLSVDDGLGWLYVAAESGDLSVFDVSHPVLTLLGHADAGKAAHTVAVDPSSHRAFLPLMAGPRGTPVLRILQPAGT
jgi:DNA-binding beta-propeller fold protein YncE